MISDLIRLIFPKECPGCGHHLVKGEEAVCLECLMEIGQTGFHEQPRNNALYDRLGGRIPLSGAAAYAHFDKVGRLKRIVEALKYKNQPRLGTFMGQLYGEELSSSDWIRSVDALVPVPLHHSRMATRGYNQSQMLAEGLSRATGIPIWQKGLVRAQKTATQTRKTREERWQNVRDVFEVRKEVPQHVLLIDDIVTTGATLEACTRTLLAAGPEDLQVGILALAIAGKTSL